MAKDFLKVTMYAAVFGIIGGMSFQGYNLVSDKITADSVQESETKETIEENGSKEEIKTTDTNIVATAQTENPGNGVSDVAEKVLPSIVAVDITATVTQSDWFGRQYSSEATGSGSGIIIREGEDTILIATNNHVVEDAQTVTIRFCDDETASAEVKGTESSSDLAVVEVKKADLKQETLDAIKVITSGSSEDTKVGEQAIAIGNALGYGTSVTVGIVSAKDREVAMDDCTMELIQTDAAINPGNSGGALVNAKGELIGINSAKYASEEVEGMGFAIPIDRALPIIEEIMDRKAVSEDEQSYLGIRRGREVGSEYAAYYNMPEGVYVGEVAKDSPAEKAGLYQGDIITKFNDREIKTMEDLEEKLYYTVAGTKVTLTVQRMDNGKYREVELSVTLGNKKEANISQ